MPNPEVEQPKRYEKAGKRLVQAVEVCIGGLAAVALARTELAHTAIKPIVEGLGWGMLTGGIMAGPFVVSTEIIRAQQSPQDHDGQQG